MPVVVVPNQIYFGVDLNNLAAFNMVGNTAEWLYPVTQVDYRGALGGALVDPPRIFPSYMFPRLAKLSVDRDLVTRDGCTSLYQTLNPDDKCWYDPADYTPEGRVIHSYHYFSLPYNGYCDQPGVYGWCYDPDGQYTADDARQMIDGCATLDSSGAFRTIADGCYTVDINPVYCGLPPGTDPDGTYNGLGCTAYPVGVVGSENGTGLVDLIYSAWHDTPTYVQPPSTDPPPNPNPPSPDKTRADLLQLVGAGVATWWFPAPLGSWRFDETLKKYGIPKFNGASTAKAVVHDRAMDMIDGFKSGPIASLIDPSTFDIAGDSKYKISIYGSDYEFDFADYASWFPAIHAAVVLLFTAGAYSVLFWRNKE